MTHFPRRYLLRAALATPWALSTMTDTLASGLSSLGGLKPSERLPVVFIGHGSPMNVITDNPYRPAWEALGAELLRRQRPQLILCVSAHWLTRGWWLTGMERPRTIHDFGGFPQALFDQQYPAPGHPGAAAGIAGLLAAQGAGVDAREWGLDHGAWSVLKPMFPAADIPVLQLGMDYSRPLAEHHAIGRALRPLRERGVLIVGSGNIVHNLRVMREQRADGGGYDWAEAFDAHVAQAVEKGDAMGLAGVQRLGSVMQMAHPTHDHYLPLLHAAGATHAGEPVRMFNASFQGASISMRSFIWG